VDDENLVRQSRDKFVSLTTGGHALMFYAEAIIVRANYSTSEQVQRESNPPIFIVLNGWNDLNGLNKALRLVTARSKT
jgi:hypothetical protein